MKGNEEIDISTKDIFNLEESIENSIKKLNDIYPYNIDKRQEVGNIFSKLIEPNVFFSENLTDKISKERIDRITIAKGKVQKGSRIIEQGEIVDEEIYSKLKSIEYEYKNKSFSGIKYYLMILGYTILVFSIFGILFLFLSYHHYKSIISSYKNSSLILASILLIFFISLFFSSIGKYDQINMVYILPVTILPILIRTFYDHKVALFVHIVTLLLISIYIKDSFEFFYMNILAGVVSLLSKREIHKRSNLFMNVGKITVTYSISFYCILLVQKGGFSTKDLVYLLIFLGNGILTLFSLPLIYVFEKIFGIVSDVTLLELSDTNNPVLKRLSLEAPGTFQHSLQVANISENIAREINGNTLLVRAGALYHDIGKLISPEYFTENQYGENIHNKLSPLESAKIIIGHREEGLILANKYKLPKVIQHFIETHHGTSLVYFFYKKQEEEVGEGNVNKKDFAYPGRIPFSKEMAILMMSDSVEAASKSLDSPTEEDLKKLIEKIVDGQVNSNQFRNTDITFREIEIAKKNILKSLKSIYKNRIKYPD